MLRSCTTYNILPLVRALKQGYWYPSHVMASFVPMENLVHGPPQIPEDTSSPAWAHLIFESVSCNVRYLSHVMLWLRAYFEYLVSHPPSCLQVPCIMAQGAIDTFSGAPFPLGLHGSAFVRNQPQRRFYVGSTPTPDSSILCPPLHITFVPMFFRGISELDALAALPGSECSSIPWRIERVEVLRV